MTGFHFTGLTVSERRNIHRLPADVGGRIEGVLHLFSRHLLEGLQWNAVHHVSLHNEIDGAVTDSVAIAAIIVGNALQAHIDDAKDCGTVLH